MTPTEHFIDLTKRANLAGIAGDHRELMRLQDQRQGFGDCWEMMTGRSYGHLLMEADWAMTEIYGEVNMCGGILNDFAPHRKEPSPIIRHLSDGTPVEMVRPFSEGSKP